MLGFFFFWFVNQVTVRTGELILLYDLRRSFLYIVQWMHLVMAALKSNKHKNH